MPDHDSPAVSARFEQWRQANPGRPFSAFYAEDVEAQLGAGRPHATLGGKLKWDRSFECSGLDVFDKLRRFGLAADAVCVDYGCGTLRVGQHVIRHLPAGAYWGLDISATLLDRGRTLLGEALLAEKQPNLRVITPASLAEVAALKPGFVFSNAVLMHVHPDELGDFAGKLMALAGRDGQAVFSARCSQQTVHYHEKSWSYAPEALFAVFAAQGATLEALDVAAAPIEGVADCKRYWWRARR